MRSPLFCVITAFPLKQYLHKHGTTRILQEQNTDVRVPTDCLCMTWSQRCFPSQRCQTRLYFSPLAKTVNTFQFFFCAVRSGWHFFRTVVGQCVSCCISTYPTVVTFHWIVFVEFFFNLLCWFCLKKRWRSADLRAFHSYQSGVSLSERLSVYFQTWKSFRKCQFVICLGRVRVELLQFSRPLCAEAPAHFVEVDKLIIENPELIFCF